MKKLGGESFAGLSRNDMTYQQDRMHSQAVCQIILQQNQIISKQNQEMLNMLKEMNKKLDYLTNEVKKLSADKVCGGHTLTDSCAAMESGKETICVANYSIIDQHLKGIRKDIGRCIIYFWEQRAVVSFQRLPSGDKSTYKSAFNRRRRMFTPFINYGIKKMGGEECFRQALETSEGRKRAQQMLQDVLTMVRDYFLEQKFLKEGTKNLTVSNCIQPPVVYEAMVKYVSGLET
jgi:hypothetical protein